MFRADFPKPRPRNPSSRAPIAAVHAGGGIKVVVRAPRIVGAWFTRMFDIVMDLSSFPLPERVVLRFVDATRRAAARRAAMAVFTFLPLLTQTGSRSSAHRLCNLIRPPKRPADSGNGHPSDVVLLGWKPSLFQIDSPRRTQAARGHRTNGFARVPRWPQRYF